MKRLIQNCKNSKIQGYSLPTFWESDKRTVISLDFSDFSMEMIEYSVIYQIMESLYEDKNEREINLLRYKNFPARQVLREICQNFQNVVLLIDEYDNPLNKYLFKDQIFADLSENFYMPFFSTVKGLIQKGTITQCVTTGILKFNNVGIFSGFDFCFIISPTNIN